MNYNGEDVGSYVDFMTNVDNVRNCKDCPENFGFSDWQGTLPCGQQNCWVTAHCNHCDDVRDDD